MTDSNDVYQSVLEGKLAHLRLELAVEMQELREASGLTQGELAERLDLQQPARAALERAGDHKIEDIVRYLHELGADLLVAVKQGDTTVQVSEDDEQLVVALPREVDERAAE